MILGPVVQNWTELANELEVRHFASENGTATAYDDHAAIRRAYFLHDISFDEIVTAFAPVSPVPQLTSQDFPFPELYQGNFPLPLIQLAF